MTVRVGVAVEVVIESLGRDVIEVRSTTDPEVTYRVDTVRGRCSCKGWTRRKKVNGRRLPCIHLIGMGIESDRQPNGSSDPFIEE